MMEVTMRYLRWLWCWLRHERISGVCLQCAGVRPISGGQDELMDFASGLGGGAYSGGGDAGTGVSAVQADAPYTSAYSGGGAPESGGGGGFLDFAKSLAGGIGEYGGGALKGLTGALGLGAQGLGIANQLSAQKQMGQQNKILQQGQAQTAAAGQRAEATAAPAAAFGTETLKSASQGNLTPSLQAGIDNWVQQAKADAASRFASMGLGNSSQLNQFNLLIDQHAAQMKGQMLTQQEETGLAGINAGVGAAGVSAGAGSSVMGSSQAQQQTLAKMIEDANAQITRLAGSAAA